MTTESKLHVYDVLARSFIQEGVKTCFTLMGDANMNWASKLASQGCRMVYVRHEHCAAAAAMAYARKTGDVGVATVTCGPGVTQLITALPAAVREKNNCRAPAPVTERGLFVLSAIGSRATQNYRAATETSGDAGGGESHGRRSADAAIAKTPESRHMSAISEIKASTPYR